MQGLPDTLTPTDFKPNSKFPFSLLKSVFQYSSVAYLGPSHYLISLLSVKCVLIFTLPLCILHTRTLKKMNEHLNHSLDTIQS